jgi:predicted phage replisome organizer
MATGKRYYWIKLKDSFMSSDEIDYLMSQPDGANYVVLYQMLCLKTINTNGCLVSKIGEMLIPYDAEKIQRECKWFPLSTVRLALTVYKQIGLIFENPDGTLSISDYQNMIGSETDWAAKNRKIRSNAANKELQAGHDTGHTTGHNVSTDGGENVPTEKEIEKDKDIENRERVRDKGSPTVDAGLAEIIRSFEDNIGSFPPAAKDALMGWREIFTDDLILMAIKKAALAGIRKWSYVNGILKAWKNEGVRTLGDVQSRDERRKPPAGQQPKRSAAEDYNEIFGELLGGST